MGAKEKPFTLTKRTVKLANNRKKVIYYYSLPSSKKRISTGLSAKSDAIDFILKKIEEEKEEKGEISSITFENYMKRFFGANCPYIKYRYSQTGKQISPNTIELYKLCKAIILNPSYNSFLNTPLNKVEYKDIVDFFYKVKTQRKISNNYLQKLKVVLSLVFTYAIDVDKLAKVNPVLRHKVGSHKAKEKGIFTDEELEALFGNGFLSGLETYFSDTDKELNGFEISKDFSPFQRFRDKVLFLTLFSIGCRVGELRALKWGDIDEKKRRIRITRNIQTIIDNEVIFGDTKNHRERIVPYSRSLQKALDYWKMITPYTKPTDFIFCREDGTVFKTNEGITKIMNKALNNIGITKEQIEARHLSVHSFRHTANSFLVQRGVNVATLRDVFGWGNEDIQRIYTHIQDKDKDIISDKLDDTLVPFLEDEGKLIDEQYKQITGKEKTVSYDTYLITANALEAANKQIEELQEAINKKREKWEKKFSSANRTERKYTSLLLEIEKEPSSMVYNRHREEIEVLKSVLAEAK